MSNFKTQKLKNSKKNFKKVVSGIAKSDTQESKDETISQAKKSRPIKKYIIGGLMALLAIIFIGNITLRALGNISISGMNSGTSKFFIPTEVISATGSIPKLQGTTNILIAGVGGAGHEGSLLTDSLMLASINQDDKKVTLLSIPRDLYVAYPKGYGVAGKINALYSIGTSNKVGISLLAEKVTEITGQPIDGYVVIDFNGFKSIIDALGGIEVDVPRDLIDREYPNDNWGYQVFSVKAGLQTFDGDTALKYARSRHSTSDFDRSERQQILLKSIKERALSIGFLTNPGKITDLFNAVSSHIDTSFNLGDIVNLTIGMRDISSQSIDIYTLSNTCIANKCEAGAFLYTPSREYFGGASVVIPENATASRLSYYDDIRRFSGFIFRFPEINNELAPISIVVNKGKANQGNILLANLEKLGFKLDNKKFLVELTGSTITTSHVNIYWNEDAKVGINPEGIVVTALKFLEEKIPYSLVIRNEYVTTDGPRIEIVLGSDASSYFTFAKPAYYLPYIPSTSNDSGSTTSETVTTSGESSSVNSSSGKPKSSVNSQKSNPETPTSQNTPSIKPGEWENF